MKQRPNTLRQWLRKWFSRKTMVVSTLCADALLIGVFQSNGKKFVRVAFTNRLRNGRDLLTTDILYSQCVAFRRLPSLFAKTFLGSYAKTRTYVLAKGPKGYRKLKSQL